MQTIHYVRKDPALHQRYRRAGKLLQQFNSTDYEDKAKQVRLLTELLGSVGTDVVVEHHFHCDLGDNIHVGDHFYAGFNCTILDIAPVTIGHRCLIGPNVGLYTSGHQLAPQGRHLTGQARPITIGHDVWIGGHSVVLGGVQIGDGAIVAAGSVVIRDVPAYTVYGGQPAQKLKDIPRE